MFLWTLCPIAHCCDTFSDTSTAGSGYLVVANRLYLHQISLDGSRLDVVVGGLSYVVAVDFHFRNNSLFWVDSGRRAIMKSTLDGLKQSIVLDHGLTKPGTDINKYCFMSEN